MSNFAVRILTGADVDIEQAIEWYEHQKYIFYAIDEYNEVVEVIAVLHQAINPKELRKRINFE